MNLATAVCLLCSAQVSQQVVKSYTIDQILVNFRTGMESQDMVDRTNAIYRSSHSMADRQKALFLLGRQYHRSYEKAFMVGSKSLDAGKLKLAHDRYHDYINHAGWDKSEWLSDARFYKAFYYLESGDIRGAQDTLKHMQPDRDPAIFVDDIVWTQERSFSVLQDYDAGRLRDALLDFIKRHAGDRTDVRVQGVATDLRTWCRSFRYSKRE